MVVENGVVRSSPIAEAMVARRLWVAMVEAILSDKEKDKKQRQAKERRERQPPGEAGYEDAEVSNDENSHFVVLSEYF